jgi:DNA-binding MarR family transcriptional regulator
MAGHAILLNVAGNQRHAFGLIAESWGDVLIRIREYGSDKWTINQIIILHSIFSDHLNGVECTVTRLVKELRIPQQTVSNAIATLRAAGMITEKLHPDDGRIKLLFPTAEALKKRNRVWSEAIGLSPFAAE